MLFPSGLNLYLLPQLKANTDSLEHRKFLLAQWLDVSSTQREEFFCPSTHSLLLIFPLTFAFISKVWSSCCCSAPFSCFSSAALEANGWLGTETSSAHRSHRDASYGADKSSLLFFFPRSNFQCKRHLSTKSAQQLLQILLDCNDT